MRGSANRVTCPRRRAARNPLQWESSPAGCEPLKGVHRRPEGVPTEPAVLRKKSVRLSITETRITIVGDVLDGASCIVPVFARRIGVKTSRMEGNLREIGFADSLCLGPCGLSVVSIRRAIEAEHARAYIYDLVEIRKVTIN